MIWVCGFLARSFVLEDKDRSEMEPPSGVWASIWNLIRFLPYFVGLLILGTIKGLILCPLICLIMTIGISAIILGLWPAHLLWTYYCMLRTRKLGPILKIVLCPCIVVVLLLWPIVGIVAGVVGGVAYGFLSPVFATFDAVGEGKEYQFFHCIYDGTWSTAKGCFTFTRDFLDVCFHSYFSIMDDLRLQAPPGGKPYDIRVFYLPGALIAALLGILLDVPVISVIAVFKSPYMLFRGWQRLLHDLIGREGPFLETICVPFAGLAILLWPLAVVGSVLGSVVSSVFLGAYSGVVAYQESSLWMGICFVLASLAIYDEYSNDVLDLREGSCFPRPSYRNQTSSAAPSPTSSFSRGGSLQKRPSRTGSIKNHMVELKPLELLDSLFKESRVHGESMVSQGIISLKDIEDATSGKDGNSVISVGLPAYCLLQALIRSAKVNSAGILLNDNVREITITNRPKDTFFDWFLNPLLIIKDQIIAQKLSESEEDYLGKLVLLNGNSERFKNTYLGTAPESELKRAELDALARRLRGITKSISRYPTFRRRFESLVKNILEDLTSKKSGNGGGSQSSSRNGGSSGTNFIKILSQRSFKRKESHSGSEKESNLAIVDRDLEIR